MPEVRYEGRASRIRIAGGLVLIRNGPAEVVHDALARELERRPGFIVTWPTPPPKAPKYRELQALAKSLGLRSAGVTAADLATQIAAAQLAVATTPTTAEPAPSAEPAAEPQPAAEGDTDDA